MPSHTILPEARRAALAAAVDEALNEVREASDVALLQECRALFRARVPLHLRAYVAAALALKAASGPSGRRGNDEDGRRRKPAEQRGRDSVAKADKPAREPKKAEPRVREERSKETKAVEREVREVRERASERENRYRGEGVTLFVSAGRRQRFYARVAAKIVAEAAGIGEERIGDIRTMDNYSFVVVDPAVEESVLAALSGYDWKGRSLTINRARKRGEGAPEAGDSAVEERPGLAGEPEPDDEPDADDDPEAYGEPVADGEPEVDDEPDADDDPEAYGEPDADDESEVDDERDPTAGA